MFLLDIRYDRKTKKIAKWIKDNNICKPVRETYFPKIYISGIIDLPFFDKVPGIIDLHFEEKSTALGRKPERVICATVDPNFIYDITSILEFHGCCIYNVSISTVRQYLLEKKLFPTANLVDVDKIDDDQYALDYNVNLVSKDLSVVPKIRGIFSINDQIDRICLGNDIIEGREKYIIEKLNSEIMKSDPDLILTNNGDSFELPYLYHRASLHNIRLQLGREKGIDNISSNENLSNNKKGNKGNGRSYFSYGKIYYKPRGCYLSGRLHIDRSSFLFREGGLSGIIDISRITGIPLQELSRLSPGSAVNALQANQAIRDGVLIQWKGSQKNVQESLETVQQSALILEPKVGLHERIYELDFISLFPNIMVNHNISPETVLCDCCPNGQKVPFVNYNICQKSIGLIPRVLRPLIDRRLTYKKRAKDAKNAKNLLISEEYDKKQKVIKWLLVTSFGYMGFNKAQFGSMDCYNSITAYARDILLRTIKLSEDMGYDVLHGLVDCVWIKGPDPEKLQKIITRDIGIDIERKGFYNWIVFLPNKSDDNGSPYRYYGLMDNCKLKIRGIESRQGSTPNIIRNLQEDMLNKLSDAKTASQFHEKIPKAIDILREYTRQVLESKCQLSDLIFEIRVSRSCNEYSVFNNSVAALIQYEENNIEILPGQSVRYIITDSKSRDPLKRVIIPELTNETTKYDKEKYYNYLLKATESILLPFGYSSEYLDEIMNKKIQTKLYQYGQL